jgi:hypothetical protein
MNIPWEQTSVPLRTGRVYTRMGGRPSDSAVVREWMPSRAHDWSLRDGVAQSARQQLVIITEPASARRKIGLRCGTAKKVGSGKEEPLDEVHQWMRWSSC